MDESCSSESNCESNDSDSDDDNYRNTVDERKVSLLLGGHKRDYDIDDDVDNVSRNIGFPHRSSTSTGSSEVDARVGQIPLQSRFPPPNYGSNNKGKEKAVDENLPHSPQSHILNHASLRHHHLEEQLESATSSEDDHKLIRWKSKEKKKTKDEGETGKIRRLFGSHRGKAHIHSTVYDDPDLEFDNGHNSLRSPTSGALGTRFNDDYVPHPILVSSPLSSEVDLPSGNKEQAVFISSPVQSVVDINTDDNHDLVRPNPTPIQHLSAMDSGGNSTSKSSNLGPGIWYPAASSITSIGSGLSGQLNKRQVPHRGDTWATAKESVSSVSGYSGAGQSFRGHAIVEVPEKEREHGNKYDGYDIYGNDNGGDGNDDDDDDEDEEEHYTLAKMISKDSVEGAGVGVRSPASTSTSAAAVSPHQGSPLTRFFSRASSATTATTTTTTATAKSKDEIKPHSILKKSIFKRRPTDVEEVAEEKEEEEEEPSKYSEVIVQPKTFIPKTDVALEPDEPLSRTISKAGTRLGKAIKSKAPPIMKRRDHKDSTVQFSESRPSSACSHNNCDLTPIDPANSGKKQVRFMTKVQSHIAASRQSTAVASSPIIKQDRMLVRKEVSLIPGPQLYNAVTAKKMERQSSGWREWWCVLKGPPSKDAPVKITKKTPEFEWKEKGRLEFYLNHKKINSSVILTSNSTITVYSSLDYSMAVTQTFKDTVGITAYIFRPRTITLACAWYMEIYTLLHGSVPIPNFIELSVPDFDVKIRVPIPEGIDSDDEDYSTTSDDDEDGTELSSTLPLYGPEHPRTETIKSQNSSNIEEVAPIPKFKTAQALLPSRLASKSFYLNNDQAKPTLVTPDKVTPKILRTHALSLLKQVPDWTEVVSMWQDPSHYGDVALCWKRYDRIEWVYWTDEVFPETSNMHLRKAHIGFADGSEWTGGMDGTVVGPQVLDKTHKLELRPITHYPTKVMVPQGNGRLEPLHEPEPIEGYLVRVSKFSGGPLKRFRRLYLTSHDHLLLYTVPSSSHSPTMSNAGIIDPESLVFSITPHKSANPDHKDMSQSHSVRRLKAQVRAAQGFIDLTKVGAARVLKNEEWNYARHMSFKMYKKRQLTQRKSARETLEDTVKKMESDIKAVIQKLDQKQKPEIIIKDADNYLFAPPTTAATTTAATTSAATTAATEAAATTAARAATTVAAVTPVPAPVPAESSKSALRRNGSLDGLFRKRAVDNQSEDGLIQRGSLRIKDNLLGGSEVNNAKEVDGAAGALPEIPKFKGVMRQNTALDASEPLSNSLGGQSFTSGTLDKSKRSESKSSTFLRKTATFFQRHRHDKDEDSNIIEIEMQDGKSCVRFRAYSPEAAKLWCDQINKLSEYWRLRKRQDVKDHLAVRQGNSAHLSTTDDDEYRVTIGGGGITIQEWDNERSAVSPEIWNWCVANGCRSITKSGFLYIKLNAIQMFRKMFVILTEGFLMVFHPYSRSGFTGTVIPSAACELVGIYSLKDIYIYSGHFSDADTNHGTNDESESLPRFFADGLIVDDPDEDCTFSVWRGQRKKMFSRRGSNIMSMSSRPVKGSSRVFGKNGVLSNMVKDGIIYGAPPNRCSIFRARSRPELEEWVYAINTEIERIVRVERKRVFRTSHML
ncbi:hypothetical protein BGZ76_009563 [Entomortierella beljakovae]|nr:hypothetical protein BGZ76_009563 [Entomortierella beljakovae]